MSSDTDFGSRPGNFQRDFEVDGLPDFKCEILGFPRLKPCSETVKVYPEAGTSAGAENPPASVLSIVRLTPLESFVRTTIAPGMIAPLESRTVPDIAPNPATA